MNAKHPQLDTKKTSPDLNHKLYMQPRPQEIDDNKKFIIYTNTDKVILGAELIKYI